MLLRPGLWTPFLRRFGQKGLLRSAHKSDEWMENRARWWGGAEEYHIALIFDANGVCGVVTSSANSSAIQP
jgi:hypothetical protein